MNRASVSVGNNEIDEIRENQKQHKQLEECDKARSNITEIYKITDNLQNVCRKLKSSRGA